MYAVIKSGGKQYKVASGDVIRLESLLVDVGESVVFDEVLMIAHDNEVTLGKPKLNKASVCANVLSHGRAKKIEILKFKRRKHHMKRMGHRQNFTEVKITHINTDRS